MRYHFSTPAFPIFRVAETLHLGSHLVWLLCEEETVTLLQCDAVSMETTSLARLSLLAYGNVEASPRVFVIRGESCRVRGLGDFAAEDFLKRI
jgi:hypothetical protein